MDTEYYVPVKLSRTVGSIHNREINLYRNYIEKKIIMGYYRDRLERSQCDFGWEQGVFTNLSHYTAIR